VLFGVVWTSETRNCNGLLMICSKSMTYRNPKALCVFSLVFYLLKISWHLYGIEYRTTQIELNAL